MSDFVYQSVLAISVIQDKKIGWEEFQIMINPPPPPKAPTPHKVTEVFKSSLPQGGIPGHRFRITSLSKTS